MVIEIFHIMNLFKPSTLYANLKALCDDCDLEKIDDCRAAYKFSVLWSIYVSLVMVSQLLKQQLYRALTELQ